MKNIFALLFLSALIVIGCKKEDPNENNNNNNNSGNGKVTLNITNLPNLGNKAKFEGWLIVDGQPKSLGKFTSTGGKPSQTEFTTSKDNISKATTIIITIEPEPDNSPDPTETKLLAGTFNGQNFAEMSVTHASAFNNDFLSSKGSYVIATPTTSDQNDEFSGVWFIKLDTVANQESQGLFLPALTSGWQYEGWAAPSGVISTGKITDLAKADASNIYSGTDHVAPDFPGEDFIQNPPPGLTFPDQGNLKSKTVYITIEPVPDNDPVKPFMLKVLSATVSQNVQPRATYDMQVTLAQNLPVGNATKDQ